VAVIECVRRVRVRGIPLSSSRNHGGGALVPRRTPGYLRRERTRALELATEDLGCAAIGFADPCRIDPQCGGATTTVTEPTGHSAKVDAGGKQFGG
jgi:hypothetical protein